MAAAPGHECGETSAELGRLLSWFESHGGSVAKLVLQDLGGDLSLSVVTTEAVSKGDVVMTVPISLCMTVESAVKSDLAEVLEANPEVMREADEVLALHLMCERRKGEESFWKEYIRTLPDDVDTPLRWTVEGAEEVELLHGTMVGLLTRMMFSQMVKDWEALHLPLVEAHPDVLGGVGFEDYLWALTSIWSRAFDYPEETPGASPRSRRAMVPVINAANHHPSAAGSLSEMIEFHAAGVAVDKGSSDEDVACSGYLRVVAGRDYLAGDQFFLLYGRYSNAKLLYSYGFALPENPYGSLDYWVRVPPSDPNFAWKQALLEGHPLTAAQTYDFSGTLRSGGWVSPALLASARVAQLTSAERVAAERAFDGAIVSARNEAAALGALLAGLRSKLAGQETSLSDEEQLIARLETEQRRQQQGAGDGGVHTGGWPEWLGGGGAVSEAVRGHGSRSGSSSWKAEVESSRGCSRVHREEGCVEGGVSGAGRAGSGPGVGVGVSRSRQRQIAAGRVRLEEKAVMAGAIEALERSLEKLQRAVSAGEVPSFRPLDGQ